MSEIQVKFKGWQAIVVIVILIGIVGAKFATLNDKKDDKDLMKALEVQLMSEYYPDMADKLKAAVDSGNTNEISHAAESVTTTSLSIGSVKASYPLWDFSTPKDVVVKVTYSLNDASGTYQTKTVYYLFSYGGLLNVWQYQYQTNSIEYYLNFL
jgi:hypothetical protein